MTLAPLKPLTPLEPLTGRQIIIFGLGNEGLSTYRFLQAQLPQNNFILLDKRPLSELDRAVAQAVKKDAQTRLISSLDELKASEKSQLKTGWLFKTPGIPRSHHVMRALLEHQPQISSNTQLFFELIREQQKPAAAPELITIGVTGTKGKSTTVSLIQHLLEANKLESYLGGNIGQPALDIYQAWVDKKSHAAKNYFILELSSHQLAELSLSPQIAIIQAVFTEHLDYYQSFDQYFAAKTNLTRHQSKQNQVIFNADSTTATQIAKLSPGRKIKFSRQDTELVKLAKKTPLLGAHNLYNIMPAIIVGQQLGLSEKQIAAALESFQPLRHRLELVAKLNGVEYYDDSIATNPESAIAALKTFAGRPILLLAGGYERHQDFAPLAQEIKRAQVKAIAIFPPAGQRLVAELEKLDIDNQLRAKIGEFSSMTEAVYHVQKYVQPGDVVLLSPGAASFGLFDDYRQRGNEFAQAIKKFTA